MYFVEYWLKCSFYVSCQFNAKSGAIDWSITIDLLAAPELDIIR